MGEWGVGYGVCGVVGYVVRSVEIETRDSGIECCNADFQINRCAAKQKGNRQ